MGLCLSSSLLYDETDGLSSFGGVFSNNESLLVTSAARYRSAKDDPQAAGFVLKVSVVSDECFPRAEFSWDLFIEVAILRRSAPPPGKMELMIV